MKDIDIFIDSTTGRNACSKQEVLRLAKGSGFSKQDWHSMHDRALVVSRGKALENAAMLMSMRLAETLEDWVWVANATRVREHREKAFKAVSAMGPVKDPELIELLKKCRYSWIHVLGRYHEIRLKKEKEW